MALCRVTGCQTAVNRPSTQGTLFACSAPWMDRVSRSTTNYSTAAAASHGAQMDGHFLAFITGSRTLHLWDPFALRELTVSNGLGSRALAFSPDGKQLAVGVGSNVRTYSITY